MHVSYTYLVGLSLDFWAGIARGSGEGGQGPALPLGAHLCPGQHRCWEAQRFPRPTIPPGLYRGVSPRMCSRIVHLLCDFGQPALIL